MIRLQPLTKSGYPIFQGFNLTSKTTFVLSDPNQVKSNHHGLRLCPVKSQFFCAYRRNADHAFFTNHMMDSVVAKNVSQIRSYIHDHSAIKVYSPIRGLPLMAQSSFYGTLLASLIGCCGNFIKIF